jgi:KipI family sensor histidine kinase inhibitor
VRAEPYGRDAVLLHLDDAAQVRAWHAAVEAARTDGTLGAVTDVVPGERSLVVIGAPDQGDGPRLLSALAALTPGPTRGVLTPEPYEAASQHTPGVTEIPVQYDGEDLAEVAARTGLHPDDVVRLHHEADYDVAFCGFAPGFAYLTGLPAALHLPRRDTPRPRVPAGSVAIAAGYSGVYPQASPGGWWLLGRTELTMFDPTRTPPALLQPGGRVRFTRA